MTETSRMPSLDIDLLSVDAINDPHHYFRPVREAAPIAWSERHRAWIVTGHAELDATFRNPLLSTERMAAFKDRLPEARRDALSAAIELLDGWMLFHEPPIHTRLRSPFSRSFTPRTVRSLSTQIESICASLLDHMERKVAASGGFDLVNEFSHPLPAAVIAALFGVPDELGDWLADWSARFGMVVFGATRHPDYEAVARSSGNEFRDYVGPLLDERRANPQDDLISALVHHTDANGDPSLSPTEILGACSLILFAGHDTTASLLGSATLALLDEPAAAASLRNGSGDLDLAIEELLRFEAPAKAMMRIATADHEFFGANVRAGDTVFLTILAANRDVRVFTAPDTLQLDRSPNPHLTFGHGHHFCLGASLARLEARIALPALLQRFPNLRRNPTQPVEWKPNISDRSATKIPLLA